MKNLRTALITIIAAVFAMVGMTIGVMADETTELSSMTIYAVDSTGSKTEVPMSFEQSVYEYDITVMSDVESIEIEAEVADSSSNWSVEKAGVNTLMDTGVNYTSVIVTSSTGSTNRYVINTTKLTSDEEETYEGEGTVTATEGEDTIKVGKKEYSIATSFDESEIPEGFVEDVATYNDKEYPCIKGGEKDLTAFYLLNEDNSGFFIYDGEDFYKMNNIKIKSRMYTVVKPEEVESFLENYEKETVTIIDQEVKAWVLDAEEGMYLVYAMNWNGDTNLYSYDDQEKCFQRYLTSANADSQISAANIAYENQVEKYNSLVDKYNLIIKIICGLAIVIIILIFIIINSKINKKAKKIISEDNSNEDPEEEPNENVQEEPKEKVKKSIFASKPVGRPYGDQVTFGTEDEEKEGFYGGELEEEDDIFIDITDEEDFEVQLDEPDEITAESEDAIVEEIEESLKETLKSMLPEEDSDEDSQDEDDFEFIELD